MKPPMEVDMRPMEVDMRRKEEEEDVDSFNAYDLEKEQHKHPLLVNSFIAVFLALSLWHATSLTLPEDQPTPLASSSSASASASASSSWSSWSSPSSSSSWSHSLATRPCTFAECEGGGCDEATAPYLCVDQTTPGAPYSGCSAIPWDPHATLCKVSQLVGGSGTGGQRRFILRQQKTLRARSIIGQENMSYCPLASVICSNWIICCLQSATCDLRSRHPATWCYARTAFRSWRSPPARTKPAPRIGAPASNSAT